MYRLENSRHTVTRKGQVGTCGVCYPLYKKEEGDVCACIHTPVFVCMCIKETLEGHKTGWL